MAVIGGVDAAIRRLLLTGLNSKLQAIGYANSAHLYEIQMEKTIALPVRSQDPSLFAQLIPLIKLTITHKFSEVGLFYVCAKNYRLFRHCVKGKRCQKYLLTAATLAR